MPFINLPPVVSEMFWDLDRRLRSLETAFRFNMPNVNFNTNIPTNPRVGDLYYDTYASQVTYWNGTEWVVIADDNLGVPVTTYTPVWAATSIAYGAGAVTGRYSKVGKMITYSITANCATVTNFGTGQYSVTLPNGFVPAYNAVHTGGIIKAGNEWSLVGQVIAGSNVMQLAHPTANGAQDIFSYNKPTTLTTGSTWAIGGTYFTT